MLFAATAQLPTLPGALRLRHGPLLITVETWSDGVVVARLPAAALWGEGENDAMALHDLGENIATFIGDVRRVLGRGEGIGGALQAQWLSVMALIDDGVVTRCSTQRATTAAVSP